MKVPVPGDSGLGILAPAAVSAEVSKWRRAYDPHCETVAPHLTVAYSPFVSEEEWPLVRPALVGCLRDFPPFRITLRELGAFAGHPHVLWLRPEDDGNLTRLRAALEGRFPHYVPALPFDYVPHLTVGFFASQGALSAARTAILSELEPLHFQAEELVYMVIDDDGVWRARDRLPLGEAVTDSQRSI